MDTDPLPKVGEVGRKPGYCAEFHGAVAPFPLFSPFSHPIILQKSFELIDGASLVLLITCCLFILLKGPKGRGIILTFPLAWI